MRLLLPFSAALIPISRYPKKDPNWACLILDLSLASFVVWISNPVSLPSTNNFPGHTHDSDC